MGVRYLNRVDLDREYIDIVKNNEELHYKGYLKTVEDVKNSTAMYKGKPIPFLYMPKFYTEQDLARFRELTSTLMVLFRKVMDRYIEAPEFRKKFGFSELLENLILTEHGYNAKVPMARIDIFYRDDGSFKFCEFNADGSSAMNEDRELSRILSESMALREMKRSYEVEPFELFDTWVKECISIFKEFDSSIAKPNVAIVDFKYEVGKLEDEDIDIAFIPVDPRLEEYYYLSAEYFAETIKPKFLVPMHFRDNFHITKKIKEKLSSYKTKVLEIEGKNQEFDIYNF